MGRRVAVRGVLFSGKTTTAEALEARGFHFISFTDSLKAMAAHALSASVADILADKEHYRPFLQQLGHLAGFDEGLTIPALLHEQFERHGHDADYVFDNVRFLAQWDILKRYDFTLVQLALSPMEQEQRATLKGMSHQALGRAMADTAEVLFPAQPGELILPGTAPVEDNVQRILDFLAARKAA
jgi:hypothetical protein